MRGELGHGEQVEGIVEEDWGQERPVAVADEVVVALGDLGAGHVAQAPPPADVGLERRQLAVRKPAAPLPAGERKEIDVLLGESGGAAVVERAVEEIRQIEGLTVEGHETFIPRGVRQEALQNRRLLRVIAGEVLAQAERSLIERESP